MADGNNIKFGYWGSTSEEILQKNFPLHRSCRDGDSEALSMLLIEAQHGIYIEDSFYGWTPAHWAAYFGKLACLRKLMTVTRVGVDCNIRTSRFKQTPIHLAAFGGHPQCLQWLLMSSADLNIQDYLGETPVHKAARTGSMECVSLLTSHGAQLLIKNNSGLTPAEVASSCGFPDCSRFLENAASRQDQMHCPEVPMSLVNTAIPSLLDVTANQVHPCVINKGINGGKLPPPPERFDSSTLMPKVNGFHQENSAVHGHMVSEMGDCEMEDCSPVVVNGFDRPPSRGGGDDGNRLPLQPTNGFHSNGDVTLSKGISANQVAIAGRKRCREDVEECDFKRMRKSDDHKFL